MQSISLSLAALIALAIAVAHSWLGERKVFGKGLFDGGLLRVVRAAWHLSSLAWAGAAILLVFAIRPLDRGGADALMATGGMFAASAVLTLVFLRGRHLSWPLFLLVALGGWLPAISHLGWAGVVRGATAVTAVSVLGAAAVLHLYWAAGGHAGVAVAVPERDGRAAFAPGRLVTAAVGVALVVAACVPAVRRHWVWAPVPDAAAIALCWTLAALFVARAIGDFRYVGFFKRVVGSRFAALDSAAYTPLCFVLGLALAVAASG
jgi:hypothetical protein